MRKQKKNSEGFFLTHTTLVVFANVIMMHEREGRYDMMNLTCLSIQLCIGS